MGGIRLPGPQPANPSNPAAIRAINKPCAAPRGSPGRGGCRQARLRAAPRGLRQAPREIYCISRLAAPGAPAAPLRGRTGRGAAPWSPPTAPGVPVVPWGAGGWQWLVPLGHMAVLLRSPGHCGGARGPGRGATERAGHPSRSGFGVLMAKPGGGTKVGSEARGSAGACSCSARLSVRLRFPPVPPSPLVAAGEPRGRGTILIRSLPSAPKWYRERGVQGAASLGCPMVRGWGLLGVSSAEPGPIVPVRMGCHLPAGCPGCRGGDSGLSPCMGTGIASSLPTLLQPPGAPQSGLG